MPAKYRWLICLFVGLFTLFYAVPLLPVHGTELELGFSLIWLFFCLLVIGANLYALLGVAPKERVQNREETAERYIPSNRAGKLPSR
jgi:integral membrane sensor domain MASE1